MKKFFILISAMSMLAACQKEVSRNGTSEVQIRISTGGSVGGAQTRAGNNYTDNAVVRVDVLVFDNSATTDDHLDAKLVEIKYAYKKSSGSDLYSTTLKAGSNLDLYFAINAKDIIDAAGLDVGDTWEDVQEALLMTPSGINRAEKGLPMWGYRYGETISENSSSNNFGTVYMTRAVASADVKITATNFTLLEGSVEYATNQGYLAFLVADGNFQPKGDATLQQIEDFEDFDIDKPQMPYWLAKPHIPTTATTSGSSVVYTLNKEEGTEGYDGNDILNQLYFFENDGPDSETSLTSRKYSKVVLKGIWDDPNEDIDTKESYYPLAFRDKKENGENINERVEIIRNRKFQFSISNVNGHGYPTLDEARQGEDLNIKYEIIEWDEWDDTNLVVGSDSRWVSFSPSRNKTEVKQASLYRNKTSTDEISFTTNYDPKEFVLTLTESGVAIALTEDEKEAGALARIANEFYDIVLVYTGQNGDGEATGKFIFTALKNYAPTPPISTLTVSNSYVKFLLKVDQENSSLEDWIDGDDQPWIAKGN